MNDQLHDHERVVLFLIRHAGRFLSIKDAKNTVENAGCTGPNATSRQYDGNAAWGPTINQIFITIILFGVGLIAPCLAYFVPALGFLIWVWGAVILVCLIRIAVLTYWTIVFVEKHRGGLE